MMARSETDELGRTFWIFLLGGYVITVAILSLATIGGWAFYDNPHGSNLIEVAVVALLLASLGGLVFLLPAVLLGAGLATLCHAVLGYLPIWLLIFILPICVLFESWWLMQFLGEGEPASFGQIVLRVTAGAVPALLGSWWWARRRISN